MKNKTMKKLTAALSALFILAANAEVFAVSATEYNPPYYIDITLNKNIKERINEVQGPKIVLEGYTPTLVVGIDSETGNSYTVTYNHHSSDFTVETTPGEELPVDEINEKISPYTLKETEKNGDKNVYTVGVDASMTQSVLEILSSYEQTALITEQQEIWKNSLSFIKWFRIKSPLSIEEVEEQYNCNYFDLKNLRTSSYEVDDKGNHTYLADPGKNTITNITDPEYFEKLEQFMKNDNVIVDVLIVETIPDTKTFTTVIYEKKSDDVLYGDINNDGSIDMSDLSLLSLYLIGDNDLTDNQKLAADVKTDGEINLSDLAKLKRYISKNDNSLNE